MKYVFYNKKIGHTFSNKLRPNSYLDNITNIKPKIAVVNTEKRDLSLKKKEIYLI